MPLQSSGIIVVDKTSVISSQQGSGQQQSAKNSSIITTNNSRQQQQYSGVISNNIGGTIGTPYKKQQKIIYGISSIGNQGGGGVVGNTGTVTTGNNIININDENPINNNINNTIKTSMRRHQRIISTTSSSPSSTVSSLTSSTGTQQMKQFSPINQNFNQQINQQHVIQSANGNQVIVSEEYIEQGGAQIVNISANDLLNPQIIKLVSTDGNGQNVLIDSLGNLTTTNGTTLNNHHPNSKLVVSNLTVLSSKQQQQQLNVTAGQAQQQQQINFVNAKQIPYLTTKNQTVQKIVNIPLKPNNIIKNQQQNNITGNGNIIQTTAGTGNNSGTISNAGQIVQKITMPRNVQVVARVQTVGQNQQQQTQQSNQLIMQQKYVHNINSGGVINSSIQTGTAIQAKINNTNMIKKQTINQLKVQQHKLTNLNNVNQQQVKTFIHQQQSQQQFGGTTVINQQQQQIVATPTKQIKSQKIIKQFNNNMNSSSTTVTLMQQQQQQHLTQSAGTYTINNKINNMQIHQQQQQQQKIITGNTSSKSPNTNSAKYIMQNHIVIPSNTTANQNIQSGHKINNQNTTNNISNSIVVNQQIINTLNNNICNSGNNSNTSVQPSGTIKFVNAHGTVLQQQQGTTPTVVSNQTKIRQNHLVQQQQSFQQQQQQIIGQQSQTTQFLDNSSNKAVVGENVYHIQTTTYLSPQNSIQNQQQQSSSNSPLTDDIVIVNGTQMTDELSARILQSMKSFGNQRQYQQQQHKTIHTPTSPISVQQSNSLVQQQQQHNIVVPREYPIYTTQNVQQYPAYQPVTTPNRHVNQSNNRGQTNLDKKQHHDTKKTITGNNNNSAQQQPTICTTGSIHSSSEFFRVNSNEIHKNYYSSPSPCNTTVIDNIPLPLPLPRGDNTIAAQQAEHDDDIIGEEIRPIPVTTHDIRLQALHAFLQDHTYVAPMPTRLPNEMIIVPSTISTSTTTTTAATTNVLTIGQDINNRQQQLSTTNLTTFNNNNNNNNIGCVQTSSTKMLITDNGTISTVNNSGSLQPQITNSGVYVSGNIIGQNIGIVGNTNGGLTTIQQSSPSIGQNTNNFIGGMIINKQTNNNSGSIINSGVYSFGHNVHQQLDDDANSVISNDSRNNGQGRLEMDLGEETETAPEAEAEDDSITRCICDLTHDDGYMICCDKCSVWQHVDCMGIDRQNIPDEYLCELCQPRDVDKARARSLQLSKRKEQAILMNSQLNSNDGLGSMSLLNNTGQSSTILHADINGQILTTNVDGKINLTATGLSQIGGGKKGKSKKSDLLNKKTNTTGKKERVNVKRKETKRVTKRKTKNSSNADSKQHDKHAENLRQWIENYELAVTNHYSPELRARLHAITKQQNLLQSITAHENKWLKNCQNMDSKGSTVPHAGGKILISNFDILPNSAIVELRGKYMLTTQYKTQNPSINMNCPPPPTIQTLKNHKTPGPFIFFFQLPIDNNLIGSSLGGLSTEVCVDTRTYGNEARFVRRSCRPNAELQYSFEKGTIHLYIVSLNNIMASTEITIRHEPNDLMALENVNYSNCTILPTSTVCACGLTKECSFGVHIAAHQQQQTQMQLNESGNGGTINNCTPPAINIRTTKTSRKNILNGLPEKKLKKNSNISRGRSTSSSGESNTGLLSPSINNNANINNFPSNIYSSSSISSFLHDSGIYTSSSSPSVSIPSPTNINPMVNSPSQQHQLQQIPQIQNIPQQQQHHPPPQPQIITQDINPINATSNVIVHKQLSIPIPPPIILPTLPPPPAPHLPQQHLVVKQQLIPIFPNDQQTIQEIQDNLVKNAPVNNITVHSISPPEIVPVTMEIEQKPEPEQQLIPIPTVMSPVAEQQQTPQILEEEQIVVAPVTTVKNSPQKNLQHQNSLLKKTPSKSRTTSSSEDTANNTSTFEQPTESKQRESRKLTREERKMEAIVRAFEKMEKNQQRKNELKNSKSTGSTNSGSCATTNKRRNSTSPSPKRTKSLSQTEDNVTNQNTSTIVNSQHFQQKKLNLRKKKKKGNKSTYPIQVASQRKRRRSRLNSNDSDTAITSEDSTSLLSPPLPANDRQVICNSASLPPPNCGYDIQQQNNVNEKELTLMNDLIESQAPNNNDVNSNGPVVGIVDTNVNHAAGLLLAFANPTPEKLEQKREAASPICEEQDLNIDQNHLQISQPIVSPACLLIEKALGLESFKLPPKTTKTKKSLMSDWLNQSNEDDENQINDTHMTTAILNEQSATPPPPQQIQYENSPKGLETLVQAALVDFRQNSSNSNFMINQHQNSEPPQHFNYVTKKVEAYINQSQQCDANNEINYPTNTTNLIVTQNEYNNLDSPSAINKFEVPNAVDYPQQNNLQPSLQLSSCSNSAAKKRWLRQAISEETDENAQSTATLSAVLNAVTSAGTSASNSPTSVLNTNGGVVPNGFTTPLKKRRVVVVRSDDPNNSINSPEDLCLTKSGSDSSLSNEDVKIEENYIKLKEQIEYEDDVDILRSPSPSEEKIVAENLNLVKIEPEDVSHEIKVDVEKEESSSEILKKYENPIDLNSVEKVENKCEKLEENFEDIKESIKLVNSTDCKIEDNKIKDELNGTTHVKDCNEYNLKNNFNCESLTNKKIDNFSHTDSEQLPPSSNDSSTILLKSEVENFESVSDEIADIQKKLHSFHTENIMILQSRNKKSKRIHKTDGLENNSVEKLIKEKKPNDKQSKKESKNNDKVSKKRHLSFDLTDKPNSINKKQKKRNETVEKNRKRRESSASSSSVRSDERKHSSEDSRDSKFSDESNIKKFNLQQQQPIVPIISGQTINLQPTQHIGDSQQHNSIISSYISVENYDIQTSNSMQQYIPQQQAQQYQQQMALSNQVQNSQSNSNQLPPLHLPYYNTIYGKLLDNNKVAPTTNSSQTIQSTVVGTSTPSTTTLLYADYLDTKAKSYSTLGGYVSHSSLFGLNKTNQNLTTPVVPVVTTPNTDSNSMLSPVSTQPQQSQQNSSNSNNTTSTAVQPKILTKTASHDPRLNPILTAPEPVPTPKRKLSINEYRKRKQQSTESSNNSQEGDLNSNCGGSPNDKNYDNENEKLDRLKNDLISDSSKVQFSPAPTLLEQQQEILCERLKTLKQQKNCAISSGPVLISPGTSNLIASEISIANPINNNFSLLDKNIDKDEYSSSSITTKSSSSFLLTKSNSFDSISSSSSSSCSSPISTKTINDDNNDITSQKDIEQLILNKNQKSVIDSINLIELREISKNISEMTTISNTLSATTSPLLTTNDNKEDFDTKENILNENNSEKS